jgi:hypothetical protein
MSRKHFNSLAEGLGNVRPPADSPEFLQWRTCVEQVALSCAEANSSFNKSRFLDACFS